MQFDVSDDFLAFLEQINDTGSPTAMLSLLNWATKNPDKLESVVNGYNRLNVTAKKEFGYYLLHQRYIPPEALKTAQRAQKINHDQRSLLAKALTQLRKGSFKLKMPNGVPCVIAKAKDESYLLEFEVCGVPVIVEYYCIRHLSRALRSLMENCVPPFSIKNISVAGSNYRPGSEEGVAVREAIAKNISPYVNALMTNSKAVKPRV